MHTDYLNKLFNSSFSEHLDDTLINRLSETILCDNEFHDKSWHNRDWDLDVNFQVILDSIRNGTFVYPKLLRVLVAVLYHRRDHEDRMMEIVQLCIRNKKEDFQFTGFWCYNKLLSRFILDGKDLNCILSSLENNTNIALDKLLCDTITESYLRDINDKHRHHDLIVNSIFKGKEEINTNCLGILIKKNLMYKFKLDKISHMLEEVASEVYFKQPELFFCYSAVSPRSSEFELRLIKMVDECVEPGCLISIFQAFLCNCSTPLQTELSHPNLVFANSKKTVLTQILTDSFLARHLWRLSCRLVACNNPSRFANYFLRLGPVSSKWLEMEELVYLLQHDGLKLIPSLLMDLRHIDVCCDYASESPAKTERLLLSWLEISSDVPDVSVLGEFTTLQQSLVACLDSPEIGNILCRVLKAGLDCEVWTSQQKIDVLQKGVVPLLRLQINSLHSYLGTDSLDILNSRPIELLRDVLRFLLTHKAVIRQDKDKTGALEELLNLLYTNENFRDEFFLETLFCCLLALVDNSEIGVNFLAARCIQHVILDLHIDLHFVTLSLSHIDRQLEWTTLLRDNIASIVFCPLPDEPQLKDAVKSALCGWGVAEKTIDELRFSIAYCPQCDENIDDLLEDLALTANPLECFGD